MRTDSARSITDEVLDEAQTMIRPVLTRIIHERFCRNRGSRRERVKRCS